MSKENEEFIAIFNNRCNLLLSELEHLKVEEVRDRYKSLWNDCPVELHIDDFSVIKEIESRFSDFHIDGVTRKRFTIPIKPKRR